MYSDCLAIKAIQKPNYFDQLFTSHSKNAMHRATSVHLNSHRSTDLLLLQEVEKTPMAQKRQILILIALIVTVSGCVQGLRDPDPVIVNSEERQGTLDIVQGQTTVSADIKNNGYAGDIRVTVSVLDNNETVVEEFDQIFSIGNNETKRVSVSGDVPQEAQRYILSVEAVG